MGGREWTNGETFDALPSILLSSIPIESVFRGPGGLYRGIAGSPREGEPQAVRGLHDHAIKEIARPGNRAFQGGRYKRGEAAVLRSVQGISPKGYVHISHF